MKKAITLPQYSDVKAFTQPEGVVDVQLDKVTNRLATPACPDDYTIAFIAGTEPHDTCDQSGNKQGFFSRIFGGNSEKALPPETNGNIAGASGVQSSTGSSDEEAKKKKGFFGKIVGVFKGDSGSSKPNDKNAPAPSKSGDGSVPPQ
jgi:penicillin-binding protein 1B